MTLARKGRRVNNKRAGGCSILCKGGDAYANYTPYRTVYGIDHCETHTQKDSRHSAKVTADCVA